MSVTRIHCQADYDLNVTAYAIIYTSLYRGHSLVAALPPGFALAVQQRLTADSRSYRCKHILGLGITAKAHLPPSNAGSGSSLSRPLKPSPANGDQAHWEHNIRKEGQAARTKRNRVRLEGTKRNKKKIKETRAAVKDATLEYDACQSSRCSVNYAVRPDVRNV